MRFPYKLNRSFWPGPVCRVLPAAHDTLALIERADDAEAFRRAVSTLKFGTTFKTTAPARYPAMIERLARLEFDAPPVILDAAASDGTASLAVMAAVSHSRYILTDRHPTVSWYECDGYHYFHDPEGGARILCADRRAIRYADDAGAVWPFGALARRRSTATTGEPMPMRTVELVNPDLRRRYPGVEMRRHDIFQPWRGERPDLVIAANILNRNYFSEDRLRLAIRRLLEALGGRGHFAVVDNRPSEHGSLFRLERGEVRLVDSSNGGAAVEALVLDVARAGVASGAADSAVTSG